MILILMGALMVVVSLFPIAYDLAHHKFWSIGVYGVLDVSVLSLCVWADHLAQPSPDSGGLDLGIDFNSPFVLISVAVSIVLIVVSLIVLMFRDS